MLGGAVGLGFVVICLLFARSLVKKKDGELVETRARAAPRLSLGCHQYAAPTAVCFTIWLTVPPYQTCVYLILCLQITDGRAREENLDKGIRGGMVWHFDGRVVYVCFFKVVTGEWNTEGVFFGSSSSGHVRVPPLHDGREGKRGGKLFSSGKKLSTSGGYFDSQLKLVDELGAVIFVASLLRVPGVH